MSKRDYDDAVLINAARDAHTDDPTFGYRFIADELQLQGHVASERRIWRLCSQEQLFSAFAKKKPYAKRPVNRTGKVGGSQLVSSTSEVSLTVAS